MAFQFDDFGEWISATTGSSMTTVGLVTANESSPGGFETTSAASGEVTTGGAPLVSNITTAPSAAGGPLAGTTVLGSFFGFLKSLIPATIEDSSDQRGIKGNINGNPFVIWEDSSGGINIDCDTSPYSSIEKKAQQIYDTLHGDSGAESRFPAIIAESLEAQEAFCRVFGECPSPGKMEEKLALLERVLKEMEVKQHE